MTACKTSPSVEPLQVPVYVEFRRKSEFRHDSSPNTLQICVFHVLCVLYVLYCMHCTVCIVLYVLYVLYVLCALQTLNRGHGDGVRCAY